MLVPLSFCHSATDRDGVEKMVLSWSWAQHAFIWFELNKVTLRAWSPSQDESMLKACQFNIAVVSISIIINIVPGLYIYIYLYKYYIK